MSTLEVSQEGPIVRITGSGHEGEWVNVRLTWTGEGDNPDQHRDRRKVAVSPGSDKYTKGDIDYELDIGREGGTVEVTLG